MPNIPEDDIRALVVALPTNTRKRIGRNAALRLKLKSEIDVAAASTAPSTTASAAPALAACKAAPAALSLLVIAEGMVQPHIQRV
jgi:hypothetical protein